MTPEQRELHRRGIEGVLPRHLPGGGYDVREMQVAFWGGPIPGESFGVERHANASFFGPRVRGA